jgi:PAS domain S-box-containing protein
MKTESKYSTLKTKALFLFKENEIENPDDIYNSIEELVKDHIDDQTGLEQQKLDLQKSTNELKKKQEEAKRQKNFLTAIIENTENFCCIKDLDLKIIAVNKSFSSAVGKTPEQMIGKTDAEIFNRSENEEPVKSYMEDERKAQKLKKGQQIIREETFVYPDNTTKAVLTSKFPIYDDNDKLLATANISTDISKLKKAEQFIREQDERFKLMINNSNDTFILLDKNGLQTFVSQRSKSKKDALSNSKSEHYGKFIHPDDLPEVDKTFSKTLKNDKDRFTVQYRYKHRKKGWIWLEAIAQNYLSNQVLQSILVNVREISKQKKHEMLIQSQKEELQKLIEDKNRFMQILGHDLRSPMNALLGFANLLIDDIDGFKKSEIKEMSFAIRKTATTTFNLLDDLLLWSKSQSGNLVFKPNEETIKKIFDETKNELHYLAGQKQIEIEFSENEKILAEIDKNMFKTIFRNLIGNAIKFSHKKGKIKVTCKKSQNQIIIGVSDQGIGIHKDDIDKIWNNTHFTTLGTENEQGTGLGLLLVKDLVEKHKGKIWVDSIYGKGSQFNISIPQFQDIS